MKLIQMHIEGVGGIRSLKIKFSQDMNIICGPNGIGKSTILHAISLPFLHGVSTKAKRNVSSEKGNVNLEVMDNATIYNPIVDIMTYLPHESFSYYSNQAFDKRKIIKFDTTRNFEYQHLSAINADKYLNDEEISYQLNSGVTLYNIKEWFAKRSLFADVPNGYGVNTLRNINLARQCISILNSDYSFSRVDPKNYDILVNTPTGEIWYEYLSSGFKSCMSLLLGVIKEIELRHVEKEIYAQDFDGVILIDEIELHLHPEWQARITGALTTTFPSAQFVITTHSPHVVQNAKSHQIIALLSDGNGNVSLKELPENGLGYSAWTVEEVLLDVMGMESTLSSRLRELLTRFDLMIDKEDFNEAKVIYDYLDAALHKNSVLRKSLKISLMSIREREE